jgi:hypothetical protein
MNAKRLLTCSLILNLGLVGTLAWLAKKHANRPIVVENRSALEAATNAPSNSGSRPTVVSEFSKPSQSFDWRMVESEDYKKYIANLRSIGCPEETIRDIIIADVNKLFASRKSSFSTNKFVYWKAGNMFSGMVDEQRVQQQQALNKEKRALLKELLGIEPEDKPDLFGVTSILESMLDFLPAGKQSQVAEVVQKYQAKMMKGLSGGTPDSDDLKKMQASQKEMEAELAKVLSPEELENYQLRLSQTAMMMRMQLASFDPNEQEFRDIFKLKKKFDDEFGSFAMLSQDKADKEKYSEAKKDLDAQVKTLLGDTRYADYERAQDYAYQSIYRVAEKNELGKDAAVKVYDLKKAAEDQVKSVRNDKTMTPGQRQQALRDIRMETEKAIQTVFGQKAWDSYQRQPAAMWMKNISPDPKSE